MRRVCSEEVKLLSEDPLWRPKLLSLRAAVNKNYSTNFPVQNSHTVSTAFTIGPSASAQFPPAYYSHSITHQFQHDHPHQPRGKTRSSLTSFFFRPPSPLLHGATWTSWLTPTYPYRPNPLRNKHGKRYC